MSANLVFISWPFKIQQLVSMSESATTTFLSDPGVPGPIYGFASLSLSETPCANLTDVTLADEDTISTLTNNANRAIQGNVVMPIIQSGMVAKFATNVSGAI